MNKNDLTEKILELKEQRKAVILAHNYQRGDVQDIADYAGDSLGLSQQAARTDAEVIVFCWPLCPVFSSFGSYEVTQLAPLHNRQLQKCQ